MSIINKKTPVDPDAVFKCIDAFICPLGSYGDGEKVRGSDPAIAAYPAKFVPDDMLDSEVAPLTAKRFPGQPIRYRF